MLSKSSPTNEPTISILNCYKPGLTPENAGVVWGSQRYFIHRIWGLSSFEGHPKVPTQKLTLGRSHVQNKHKRLLWLQMIHLKTDTLRISSFIPMLFLVNMTLFYQFFGANVDGFSARLLQGLSTKPWAKKRFHGCPKVVLGGRPPKSTLGTTSYLGLAPSLWSAVNCSWWHRRDVFLSFFGRFNLIICRRNVMITNSSLKISHFHFWGLTWYFFAENLLRNSF